MGRASTIFLKVADPLAHALVMAMYWAAWADGEVTEQELAQISEIASLARGEIDLDQYSAIARIGEIDDLLAVCHVFAATPVSGRVPVLETLLGVMLADGVLSVPEHHLLRLFTDVLGCSKSDLDAIFAELVGTATPTLGDPSAEQWWIEREARSRGRTAQGQAGGRPKEESHSRNGSGSGKPDPGMFDRLIDLATLGLPDGATDTQVRAAYVRLAKVHHPDRFAHLGRDAVADAEDSFSRIRAAYERLVRR